MPEDGQASDGSIYCQILLHYFMLAAAVRSYTAAEGLPLAAAAAHYGWLSRQYQVAAEMVATSRMDEAVLQVGRCAHTRLAAHLHHPY